MLFNCCRSTFSERMNSARGSYCYKCCTQERKGKIVPQVLGVTRCGSVGFQSWQVKNSYLLRVLIYRTQSRTGTLDVSSHSFWLQRSLSPNSCVCKQPCAHLSLDTVHKWKGERRKDQCLEHCKYDLNS